MSAGKATDRMAQRLKSLKTAATEAPPPLNFVRPNKDKRSESRRSAYKFARVLTKSGEVHGCIIKDINSAGARIVLEGSFTLPPSIVLKIDQTGASQTARVAWQRDNEVGLAF